ncbi:helix-loop-helix DNA-binding domain-containing protein [Chlamydoabsidia padenii]|nr:helix-loop-helix DNA-binding domain-containing protein [Chlamydoabsidia padenii]
MNVNSFYDERHYQQLLHDENDYMMPWFQQTSLPHTPALSHTSPSPHECYASNELLFSSISPQPQFADMYGVGSIMIPSDTVVPAITTSTSSSSSSSSSNGDNNSDNDINNNSFNKPVPSPTAILLSPPTPPTITMNDDDSLAPFKKVAHNAIERRYRNNINDRIRELQQVVPALCQDHHHRQSMTPQSDDDDNTDEELEEEEDGIPVAKKLNKATILQKATEYIHYLKYAQQLLRQENDMLQHIIQSLPGGQPVLDQFLVDKQRFDQAEKERRLKERKIALQQERINHQRMLKERAAQRAALMSPEERQKRRRRSSQQQKKKSSSTRSSPSRLLSVFMGMTFFAVPSSTPVWKHHHSKAFSSHSQPSWSDYWPMIRFFLYGFFITYLFILPIISKLHIRRTSIKKRIN